MRIRIAFKCEHCKKTVKLAADPFEPWLCPSCGEPVDIPIPGEGGPETITLARESVGDTAAPHQ